MRTRFRRLLLCVLLFIPLSLTTRAHVPEEQHPVAGDDASHFLTLWLRPASPDLDEFLYRIIASECRSLVGASAPFTPHVTLFSLSDEAFRDTPVDDAIETLRKAIHAWRARIGRTDPGPLEIVSLGPRAGPTDDFWECVMLLFTQSPDLDELRAAVQESFGAARTPFQPHLSLVYGDFTAEKRDAIAAEL
ncbi:hypothetical protein DFJ74DRAFT_614127, partial [Hyaloraphidium curvatum]